MGRSFFLFAIVAALAGCSTLNIRVEKPRPVAAMRKLTEDQQLAKWLDEARANPTAEQPVIEIVRLLAKNSFRSSVIRIPHPGTDLLDPAAARDLIPAGSVRIKGLTERSRQPGVGVPFVAYFPQKSPWLTGQPGVPPAGMAIPLSVVLTFDGSRPTLRFFNLLKTNSAKINGRRRQLAGDFSAPIAILLTHSKNRSIDVKGMLFTRQRLGDLGLFQFEPYDPNKIPVVLVHGLLSRPEAWVKAVNALMLDPKIRERYQFWFYLYPTGLPVWASAAGLRKELDRFHKECTALAPSRNLNRMVLIGHSMGGLISSIMIREGGDRLWRQFSDVPAADLNLTPEAKEQFMRMIFFLPRKDVSRVIFVATPHRGSKLALRPIAGFVANFIQLPFSALTPYRSKILQAIRDDLRSTFVSPANSIRFLRANSPLLLAILKLPMRKEVPVHTIYGDRGKHNSPNSTDGVVPYWSSHLDGAVSEKAVPSGHGANENPQGIAEIRRILNEN